MKHLHLTLIALFLSFASFAVAPITGSPTVCVGDSTALADVTPGGTWSSSSPAIAAVTSTGMMYGYSAGSTYISYTVAGISSIITVTVNAVPSAITGSLTLCDGMTTSLGSTPAGGIWTSDVSSVITISSTGGVATGVAVGTSTITYTISTGCIATAVVTASPLPTAISGTSTVCVGSTITVTDVSTGGIWASSSSSVGTISPTSGVFTGIAAGTATITYVFLSTGCYTTHTITVLPAPAAISGPTSICTGSSVTLASTTGGGTWSSTSTGVATVDPATGVTTGVAPGPAIISYTLPTGCAATVLVNVSTTPSAGPISGSTVVCTTGTIALTGATPGGTWSASNANATVDASGNVTGVSAGMDTITYALSGACGGGTATVNITVSTIATAGTISGGTAVCAGGSTMTLTSTVTGGTWTSSDASVATVGSSSGVVTGVAAGVVNITYTTTLVCGTSSVVTAVTVNPLGAITITGPSPICVGGTTTVSATPAFGTWSASTAILSVSSAGAVTGISAGAAAITYVTAAGCVSTVVMTVNATATAGTLSGPSTVCPVGTITLTSTVTGGTWAATNGDATISPTGIVTGVTPGLDTIIYTVTTTCGTAIAMWGVTVTSSPSAGSITGTASVCLGLTTTLSDVVTGGTWSSSATGIAAVGSSSGVVTGLTTGTATITYTVTLSCGSASTNTVVTVTPTGGAITGTASVCPGGATTLTDVISGGTWSSSAPGTATIGALTGVASGIAAGTTTVSYSLPGGCVATRVLTVNGVPTVTATATTASCGGTYSAVASGGVSHTWSPTTGVACTSCSTTDILPTSTTVYTVTGTDVNGCTATGTVSVAGDRIYGHINYTGTTPASPSTKVWLIHYNPSDSSITALDSVTTCMDGSTPYYEFDGKAAGTYLVKAALLSSVPGTSDYIPTYGVSNPSWYAATGLTHTSGTADGMSINMLYGTVPSGPGFIGGYVYSGAGKGTSGDIPVAGMLIYLRDASLWNVLTYTYTDATGAYSFSGLGTGSYIIYPEDYKYYTTPSAIYFLGGSVTTVNAVNFKQHTTSHTITPYSAANVPGVAAATSGISMYPNPTTGALNIKWEQQATGTANVSVTDVLGREVYTSSIDMSAVSRSAQADLSSLKPGIYFINIKSASVNYSNKLRVE